MQELYKAREYSAYEKQNLLNTGIAKGRAEGLVEGLEKGLAKGRAEGRVEEQLKIAKSLTDILPLEVIAEKTGLSLETLKQLKE
jgi:flagellar biosynthesis/type III secretory pathway protein FliH